MMEQNSQFIPAELIKKKKLGQEHSFEELQFLISSYVDESLPDYQMSAWLMAICFQGMTRKETSSLTQIMLDSGDKMDFSHLTPLCVDKHSTGGVGDKTSLILAPIVAACGAPVAMISGRGLGHTGGTLDKLDSMEGFSTSLDLPQFKNMVEEIKLSMIGQTKEICPADKKIYALRDVTGTVESLPLICASIMSKKIAEGIGALALDVKFGTGAFMKTKEDAKALAENLIFIGHDHKLKISASLTNMNQPLGKYIGNALEVKECLEILEGKSHVENNIDFYADTKELSLHLSAQMIFLCGKADSLKEARQLAEQALSSGKALKKFKEMAEIQNAPDVYNLPAAKYTHDVFSQNDGHISQVATEKIGVASLKLGAGRMKSTDTLDLSSGIEIHFKLGQKINKNQKLFTLFSSIVSDFSEVEGLLLKTIEYSAEKQKETPLVSEIIYGDNYGQ
ncbi:MAG: thymidine phosphorylase [Bdellovibrionaceae bacterium]|nr:thymidine phosphorylase [Pseudobdellovibrionaceae bacterium]